MGNNDDEKGAMEASATKRVGANKISVFDNPYLTIDTIPSVFKFEDESLLDPWFDLSQ
jgi:hypothetical protein